MNYIDNPVILRVGSSTCSVSQYGCHVLSWFIDGRERMWLSSLSKMDGTAPIRGGIPIAFPQFADEGSLRLHGFAREKVWQVITLDNNEQESTVTMELRDDEDTIAQWNHNFILRCTVCLSEKFLRLALEVTNASEKTPLHFTTCFHTYLRTENINMVSLNGLNGTTYIDKVDARKLKVDTMESLSVEEASLQSGGFVDRIYQNAPKLLYLRDATISQTYEITQSESFIDTVVFNPWITGKQGPQHPDFDDDGYLCLLCVEAAIASVPVELPAGCTWNGFQNILIIDS